ncbi:MAG: hypothetical protein GVY07_09210 [Bacteroidetes bacterium]|jgi:hypothetical protein|nr:hypothetical protein [Bacteroidota bacterium]
MSKQTIIYISGEGHSGTTLLDIILGSQERSFSAGELIFLQEKGIENSEYCSCGTPVPGCPVWREIIAKWSEVRRLPPDQYVQIRRELVSKKNVLRAGKTLGNPTGRVRDFLADTEKLYSTIFDTTESLCIIDSSKAPGMIPILKELKFDLTVVHIKRRFGDVLNSYKVHLKKDLKAGVEHEITPRKTSYVLASWLMKNILTGYYSRNATYKKIEYEQLIDDLEGEISKITDCSRDYLELLRNRGPLYPEHLVAGSTIRMKDELYVARKPMGTAYQRLNGRDKILAKWMDSLY